MLHTPGYDGPAATQNQRSYRNSVVLMLFPPSGVHQCQLEFYLQGLILRCPAVTHACLREEREKINPKQNRPFSEMKGNKTKPTRKWNANTSSALKSYGSLDKLSVIVNVFNNALWERKVLEEIEYRISSTLPRCTLPDRARGYKPKHARIYSTLKPLFKSLVMIRPYLGHQIGNPINQALDKVAIEARGMPKTNRLRVVNAKLSRQANPKRRNHRVF